MAKKHKKDNAKDKKNNVKIRKKDKKEKAPELKKSPAPQKTLKTAPVKAEPAAVVPPVDREELFRRFSSCSELYSLIVNSPLSCAGVPLYHAESYMLSLIADIEPINLTKLAANLGISKSGAAKTANKLILNGLVTKEKSPENSREVLFKVTPKGQEVLAEIAPATDDVFSPVSEMLRGIDEATAAAVFAFLEELETVLSTCSDKVEKSA